MSDFKADVHPRGPHGRWIKGASKLLKRDEAAVGRIEGSFKAHELPTAAHAAQFTATHRRRLSPQAVGNFHGLASKLRAGDTTDPQVGRIDAGMQPLSHDLVLTRHVGAAAFGLTDRTLAARVEGMAGKKFSDKAYLPTALHQHPGVGGVTMRISAPKGTPAMIAGDNEVWLGRDLELAVTGVERNRHGGFDMHLVVLPKAPGRAAKKATPPASSPAKLTHEAVVEHAAGLSDEDLAKLHAAIGEVRQQRRAPRAAAPAKKVTKAAKAAASKPAPAKTAAAKATPAKKAAAKAAAPKATSRRGLPDAPPDAATKLQAMSRRQEAHDYLAKATKADLIAVLDALGSKAYSRHDTNDKLRTNAVELAVGRLADSHAIERAVRRTSSTAAKPRAAKAVGRDLTGDRKALDSALAAAARHQNSSDPVMGGLSEQQGFHGLPEHGDKARLEEEIKAGGVELFRGVTPKVSYGDVVKTPQSMIEDYHSGPIWYGFGTAANGIYASTREATAVKYAGTKGAHMRLVLRADARTVDFRKLRETYERRQLDSGGYGGGAMVLADLGRYAMALGYDAITGDISDPRTGKPSGERYVAILNRTATLVEAP